MEAIIIEALLRQGLPLEAREAEAQNPTNSFLRAPIGGKQTFAKAGTMNSSRHKQPKYVWGIPQLLQCRAY
jgi:hypothetical protein